MKIDQALLSEMTDDEAADLRRFAFSCVHGGEVPEAALAIMAEWTTAHGANAIDGKPVGAFVQVVLLSLLVREETARREDAKVPKDDVNGMLKRLSVTFGEPVMPISRYCDGLRTWQRALYDRAERKRAELFPGIDSDNREVSKKAWKDYRAAQEKMRTQPANFISHCDHALETMREYNKLSETVDYIFCQIQKSSLLWRLLYGGESLRSRMCPEHKGKWNGQAMLTGCEHHCDGTGWLRENA